VTHKNITKFVQNSDKAIDLLYTVLLDRQPHEVECESLCGSKVTETETGPPLYTRHHA